MDITLSGDEFNITRHGFWEGVITGCRGIPSLCALWEGSDAAGGRWLKSNKRLSPPDHRSIGQGVAVG